MGSYGSRARELVGTENKLLDVSLQEGDANLQAISDDHQTEHKKHTHALFMAHTDHIDPSLMVFFTLKDLKVGKRMPIYFPKRDPSTSPKFWPREEADSVPFSLNQLPNLLKLFSFSPDSPQAKAMEDTLRECESKPIKGEVKFCATSLESMLDFTQSILGLTSDLQVFTTSHLTKSSVTFQNYTILENIMEISAPKMVACHTMPYPYVVFTATAKKVRTGYIGSHLLVRMGIGWMLWLFVT
ncbi:BURP domain [Sesbania bispinosa]|nr:BURP domain [Sesbania bispinosa]